MLAAVNIGTALLVACLNHWLPVRLNDTQSVADREKAEEIDNKVKRP
jgi:hypothetical protein